MSGNLVEFVKSSLWNSVGSVSNKFGSERSKGIASADDIARQIATLKGRLTALDRERSEIAKRLGVLEQAQARERAKQSAPAAVTMASPTAAKIALFRSLFRGREDVLPRRWENSKTGKAGYAPMCRNEWVRGVCGKPRVRCGECPNQAFVPIGDNIFNSHLTGKASGNATDFTVGIYPMLPDETCWFLAVDFDEKAWMQDVAAFRDTARAKGVPVAIERSRSGNGGHAWIFFAEPAPAADARRLGALLVTATMDRCPDIGFDSYDRFFPSQDTMPAGGFGNLIALPLQNRPRENGNRAGSACLNSSPRGISGFCRVTFVAGAGFGVRRREGGARPALHPKPGCGNIMRPSRWLAG